MFGRNKLVIDSCSNLPRNYVEQLKGFLKVQKHQPVGMGIGNTYWHIYVTIHSDQILHIAEYYNSSSIIVFFISFTSEILESHNCCPDPARPAVST